MRACGRCGHPNADHLKYCFSCGRRLVDPQPNPSTPGLGPPTLPTRAGQLSLTAGGPAPTAYALTVPLGHRKIPEALGLPDADPAVTAAMPLPARAWDSLRYVFVYTRGRIDAEARRRQFLSERDGATRVVESVLFGLGQIIAAEGDSAPELAGLVENLTEARERRDAAIRNLGLTEKRQASDDLRLGIEQSRAETEWNAYETRAAEVDQLLRALEQERAEVDEQLRHLSGGPAPAEGGNGPEGQHARRAALHTEGALVDERYRALRERAAALRASNVAARAKFDAATAARRHGAMEIAASLSAHTRDRLDAEKTIHELTIQLGRTAARLRLPRTSLTPGYAHLARLEATVEERNRQLAGLQGTLGAVDTRKLVAGLALMASVATALVTAVWLLYRVGQ